MGSDRTSDVGRNRHSQGKPHQGGEVGSREPVQPSDVDLSSHLNNPYYYVLEKYKSFYDKLVSINELKVLTLSAETGDVIWRNSLSPQIKAVSFYPQQQSAFSLPIP